MRFSRSWGERLVARRSARDGAAAAALLLVVALLAVAGCRGQPATPRQLPYRTFYAVPGETADPRGTLKGDYQWAARSETRGEALTRWAEFLKKHSPPGGEYQDAYQHNYVRSAKYELMRLEYLAGNVNEGDALLRELEDVRGRQ